MYFRRLICEWKFSARHRVSLAIVALSRKSTVEADRSSVISDVSWCSIITVTFTTSNFDVVMSNTPKTLNEVRRDRASTKRKITNMLKEGDSLLTADSGLPSTEFRKLADRTREELDILHVKNELYINSKCSELVLGDDATEEKRGFEEETIADSETNYLDEVRDRAMPMIHELIKRAERVLL